MFCGICGNEFSDDFRFCPKCGRSVSTSASVGGMQAAAVAPAAGANRRTEMQESVPSAGIGARFNYATVVFASFSVLSLLVSLAKGIVPLYLGESVVWAAVAWYWHKKGPRSEIATAIVLLLAVAVAAGEGYLVGRRGSLGNRYTYLTQGNRQYRVNAGSGRTDILTGNRGWEPVSFDSAPETIPAGEALKIGLSNGSWEDGTFHTAGKICFDVRNESRYVVQEVAIRVSLDPKPADVSSLDALLGGEPVMLNKEFGGLLDVGKNSRFCGPARRPFPTGATWSYGTSTMTGWTQ
jgi:hypothetical protein